MALVVMRSPRGRRKHHIYKAEGSNTVASLRAPRGDRMKALTRGRNEPIEHQELATKRVGGMPKEGQVRPVVAARGNSLEGS